MRIFDKFSIFLRFQKNFIDCLIVSKENLKTFPINSRTSSSEDFRRISLMAIYFPEENTKTFAKYTNKIINTSEYKKDHIFELRRGI